MELTEELLGLKPIDNGVKNMGMGSNAGSGCLSVIVLIIVSTALFFF